MEGSNKRARKEQSTRMILEQQNEYLMLELKEMKSMMMRYCTGSEDVGGDELHQDLIALTKTTEDVEAISKTLFSKQRQACDELKLALKKIAMKASSSRQGAATANTFDDQNRDYEKLVEEQKVEIEKLKRELEKQRLYKRAMELQRVQLKVSTLNARNSNRGNGDSGENNSDAFLRNTIDELNKKLEEKEEVIEQLEALNQTLIIKERTMNDELQEARKELIRGVGEACNKSILIGVKRMGDLDPKPFRDVIAKNRKFCSAEELRSISLCCLWEEYIRDPNWHPFKIIKVGGKDQEIIDEED